MSDISGDLLSSQMGVDYEPLYTRLSVDDAAAITEKLDAAKIKYKLEDEGSTILVPAARSTGSGSCWPVRAFRAELPG